MLSAAVFNWLAKLSATQRDKDAWGAATHSGNLPVHATMT